ncbi:MAG TPA: topoisomerase DNA-binding C4 zinc finger domain-containing protein [Lacunisphaera sp.]|nr:topoisomerase DNA-binding C4 zinc finger domain-containing protein [Lacunisphaera sp.]
MIPPEPSATLMTLEPNDGYRITASFQTTTLIYDATVWFCEKFLDPRSRPADNMVQAARSGRQNLAKGRRASATSPKMGLRLLNLARASLEELLLDYEDFLRHRRVPQWAPDGAEASAVRAVARAATEDQPDQTRSHDSSDPGEPLRFARYARWLEHADAAVRANAVICLLHQANLLLDREITAQEAACRAAGDHPEPRITGRSDQRTNTAVPRRDHGDEKDPPPACPKCGALMVLRTAKGGKNPGSRFWGCNQYPQCKGTAPLAKAGSRHSEDDQAQGRA